MAKWNYQHLTMSVEYFRYRGCLQRVCFVKCRAQNKNIHLCVFLITFFISLQRQNQCMWTKQFHSVGHIAQSILSHFQWPGKHRLCWKKKLEEEKKKKREKKTCQYSCRQIAPSLSTWIWNLFPWRKWLSGKWRHGALSHYCSIWAVLRNNNDNEFEKQHFCCCYNKIVINEGQKSQTLKKAMG